jgi:adenine phosphoribosyltransferase
MTIDRQDDDLEQSIRRHVREIPDFPKPGVKFKDITPLLADPRLFARTTEAMAAPFLGEGIDYVVAVESRGFILGAPVALHLGAGFVPVRKPGKLPHTVVAQDYELEYGSDRLEIHSDSCGTGTQVLLVDDVLATGGTAEATCRLIERVGARVAGCSFLLALSFLSGLERLGARRVAALVTY